MLKLVTCKAFDRDYRRAEKRNKDINKLLTLLELLSKKKPIPIKNKDHALKGNWAGYRSMHIEPDWVLIYSPDTEKIKLTRMGTHAELFDE